MKRFSLLIVPRLILFSLGLGVSLHASAGWERTWIDKFDGNSVDWSTWTAQTQANYNNEVQCYTDDDSSELRNYEVSDGTLKIIARRGEVACEGQNGRLRPWTSGRLNSKDKAEFLYGRLEARVRMHELNPGTWAAFWMLENRIAEQPIKGDDDVVGWPNFGAGEIDVWEWYANDSSRYITNFFNANACGAEYRFQYEGGEADVLDFHDYAIEWADDNIKFIFNSEVIREYDFSACSQYDEPMFVLINLAMGGNLGGAIDPNLDIATYEIDYVAHCVASSNNNLTSCNESTPVFADTDGDGVGNSDDQCPGTPVGASVDGDGCEIVEAQLSLAPVPEANEEDVISLFSDAYQNITNINYNPNWGQTTQVSQIELEGDTILKYENLNYQGTDFSENIQDVSTMDSLHLDYWSEDSSDLAIYLISPGPIETAVSLDITDGAWSSVAIPLSDFTNVNLQEAFQLKVEGNGTVYLDNIYFSKASQSGGSGGDNGSGGGQPPINETPPISEDDTDSGSSGGSMGFILLLVFIFIFPRRIVRQK